MASGAILASGMYTKALKNQWGTVCVCSKIYQKSTKNNSQIWLNFASTLDWSWMRFASQTKLLLKPWRIDPESMSALYAKTIYRGHWVTPPGVLWYLAKQLLFKEYLHQECSTCAQSTVADVFGAWASWAVAWSAAPWHDVFSINAAVLARETGGQCHQTLLCWITLFPYSISFNSIVSQWHEACPLLQHDMYGGSVAWLDHLQRSQFAVREGVQYIYIYMYMYVYVYIYKYNIYIYIYILCSTIQYF